MKNLTSAFLSILLTTSVYAQNDLPISKLYEIPYVGEQLLIELNSSKLGKQYTGSENFEIFGPNDTPLTEDYISICSFSNCSEQDTVSEHSEIRIRYPKGDLNKVSTGSPPVFPFGITPKRPLKQGKYTIVIRDPENGKVIHRRILTLISPEPEIRNFRAVYPDGSVTDGELKVDPNRDLKNVKIQFEGQHLDDEFKSVTLQGLNLERTDQPNTFITGDDWVPEKLRTVSLEDPKVVFERYNVQNPYSYEVSIKAPKPKINGNLVYKVNAGESRYLLKLKVTNLFKRAQVRLGEVDGGNVLEVEGTIDDARVDLENRTISQYIQLTPGALRSGSAHFSVQVINRDGSFSKTRIVHLQVQESTITALPLSNTRPFLEEVPNLVKFTRSNSSPVFQFEGEVLLMLNDKVIKINPQNIDGAYQQFTAEVILPAGTGQNAPFELRNNGHVWKGFITGTVPKPQVMDESRDVLVGSSTLIHLKHPSSKVKAITEFEDNRVRQTDNDFSDGVVEIKVDASVPVNTIFTTTLYYDDHVIETINYEVKGWPDPRNIVELKIGDSIYSISEKKIILPANKSIALQCRKDQQAKIACNLTTQLVNSSGSKLGTASSMIYDKERQAYNTSLSPHLFGLRGGDEFMVELTNPSGQPVLQRVYIKRRLKDRFDFKVGISAINIFLDERLDENGEELPNTSLISGVNLGSYYLFEGRNEGKRPFGVGVNLMAQEHNQEVRVRFGMSGLVYETISLGLNFGDHQTAVFLGAHVDFVDLSKIFTGN